MKEEHEHEHEHEHLLLRSPCLVSCATNGYTLVKARRKLQEIVEECAVVVSLVERDCEIATYYRYRACDCGDCRGMGSTASERTKEETDERQRQD